MAIDYDLLNMILNRDQLANDDPNQIIDRIDPRRMYMGDSTDSSSPYNARRSAFDEMRPEQQGQYLLNQIRQLGNVSNAPIQSQNANVPFDVGTLDLQSQAPISTQQVNVPNNVNNQQIQTDNRPDLQPSLLAKLFKPDLAAQFPNQPNASGQNMAQDNSPSFMQNILGTVPSYYGGLLGAEESKALQSRANTQGLLGAAIGLLGGMGTRGTTAAQNIAGALSGGMQASQGAMQQGLTNYQMQQQLTQAKIAQDQAAALRADVAKVMQMPEVANNPALIASLRADPAKTLAWINENMAISKAYEPAPQVNQQTGAVTSMVEQPQIGTAVGGEKTLPGVTVTAPRSKIETEINRLLTANQRLTTLPGKTAQDAIKNNLDQITGLQKQSMREDVSNFDFNGIKSTVSPDLLSQVNNLQRLAETGQISAKDLQDGLRDIQKADYEFKNSQRDYNKEAVRVAGSMFPNVPISSLNPTQLEQLQTKLDTLEIAKRKAGATNVSVSTGKAFGTEFGKGVAESVGNTFAAAQGAQSTLGAIQNIRPLIQAGVYAGPLSSVPRVVDQLATSLGITGKDDSEKLRNTAVAMQGLASLELSAAQAMKGQGAITENERSLIKRAAAGDLQTFTQPEVLALLNALEKTSQFKIKAHEKNLGRLRNRPDTADLADFYSLEQQAPAAPSAPAGVRKYNPATGRLE